MDGSNASSSNSISENLHEAWFTYIVNTTYLCVYTIILLLLKFITKYFAYTGIVDYFSAITEEQFLDLMAENPLQLYNLMSVNLKSY